MFTGEKFLASLSSKNSSSESLSKKDAMEPLTSSFVVPGRILWLPAKKDLYPDAVMTIRGPRAVPESAFARPVVVISRPAKTPHRVHFQLITGFGGQSIQDCFGASSRQSKVLRLTHIPIFPSYVEPKNTMDDLELPSAQLEGFDQMPMNSYINASDVYSAEWELLKPYPSASPSLSKSQYRLDDRSTNALLSCSRRLSGYLPGPQLVLEFPAVQVPGRALASPFRAPAAPLKQYPRVSPPQLKPERPVLTVVIPGKQVQMNMSRSQKSKQQMKAEEEVIDDCMSQYMSRVSSMFVWTGASLAQAWRRNTQRPM